MPNPSTHDESIQAELIRKRREMLKAYATPALPEVEPVEFVRPECELCEDTLYPENRSPKHSECSECYGGPKQAGFWSWEFAVALLLAIPTAIGAALLIGWAAWTLLQ